MFFLCEEDHALSANILYIKDIVCYLKRILCLLFRGFARVVNSYFLEFYEGRGCKTSFELYALGVLANHSRAS